MTIERGKTLAIKALAMAEDLTASGDKEVFFEMNGQLRSVFIRDKEKAKVRPSCFNLVLHFDLVNPSRMTPNQSFNF